jgi:peptidoglycan/LPS O-acetylase OafA/YrhL
MRTESDFPNPNQVLGNVQAEFRHHIPELQSLRGVASLTVAVSHLSSVYDLPIALRIAIDSVVNAHAALIVFFVLSGYVLTGSLLRRGLSWTSVTGFYVARVFRLFPALWVASAISVLFLLLAPQLAVHPAMSFWFYPYLIAFPSARQLLFSIMAIDRSLIMPSWTVFIELVGSLLMPLLVALSLARRRLFSCVLVATAVSAYTLARAGHRLDSLAFLFDFALGAWLASRPWKFVLRKPALKLLGAAFVLVFFRFFWGWLLSGHPVPLYDSYGDPLAMLIEGGAAFFVIGLLASEHGRVPLLRSPFSIWLGDVSYSLYLIHFPVAILVAKTLSRIFSAKTSATVATATEVMISLSIAFGLSALIYRLVEIPSIAVGKRMAQQWVGEFTSLKT